MSKTILINSERDQAETLITIINNDYEIRTNVEVCLKSMTSFAGKWAASEEVVGKAFLGVLAIGKLKIRLG